MICFHFEMCVFVFYDMIIILLVITITILYDLTISIIHCTQVHEFIVLCTNAHETSIIYVHGVCFMTYVIVAGLF